MFGSPMEAFKIGEGIGSANAPSLAGFNNVMDMFGQQMKVRMLMGHEVMKQNILNEIDPTRRIADARLKKATGEGGPTNPLIQAASGSSNQNPFRINMPSGSDVLDPNGGFNMQPRSYTSEDILGNKTTYEDPAYQARVENLKNRLQQDASFNALNSAINTHLAATKAYHSAIGPGGAFPNSVAGLASFGGDPYVSAAKQTLDTANETLAQQIAKEVNPGGIGRILFATRQQVGAEGSTEAAKVAANIQLRKDYYGIKKAYDMASISNPLDKEFLLNPDGTKKDFNNLDDKSAAYLYRIKDKYITPEEMDYFDRSGVEEYKNIVPTRIPDLQNGGVFSGPSNSAKLIAPIASQMSKNPIISAFTGPNMGFPKEENGKGVSASPKWNELIEADKLNRLIAAYPQKKNELIARFNQRKKESLGATNG